MNYKDKRDETITTRCTKKEKTVIARQAKAQNKSISEYMLGCSMAKLERRRDKDRKRMAQIIENQETLNKLEGCLENIESESDLSEVQKLLEELRRGEKLLWDF